LGTTQIHTVAKPWRKLLILFNLFKRDSSNKAVIWFIGIGLISNLYPTALALCINPTYLLGMAITINVNAFSIERPAEISWLKVPGRPIKLQSLICRDIDRLIINNPWIIHG